VDFKQRCDCMDILNNLKYAINSVNPLDKKYLENVNAEKPRTTFKDMIIILTIIGLIIGLINVIIIFSYVPVGGSGTTITNSLGNSSLGNSSSLSLDNSTALANNSSAKVFNAIMSIIGGALSGIFFAIMVYIYRFIGGKLAHKEVDINLLSDKFGNITLGMMLFNMVGDIVALIPYLGNTIQLLVLIFTTIMGFYAIYLVLKKLYETTQGTAILTLIICNIIGGVVDFIIIIPIGIVILLLLYPGGLVA